MKKESRAAAQAIANAIACSFEKSPEEIESFFNVLGDKLADQRFSSRERSEIRRRITEAKISILFKKRDSERLFRSAWNEMLALGFSNAEREATMRNYHIEFLLRTGASEQEILDEIQKFDSIIQNKIRKAAPKMAAHFMTVKRRHLKSLRSR